MLVKSGLIFVVVMCSIASLASAQQVPKQFRLCVLKSKPQECKNLDRAGSGVKCVPVEDSTDCALKLQNRTADFGMFKAEEALVTSHFLEGVTVIGDIRHEDKTDKEFSFTAVALARRKSIPGNDLSQVRNLSLCHPGMGQTHTGWSDSVLKEMDLAILKKNGNLRCDEWRSAAQNEYFSISDYWGASCRPGTWSWNEETDLSLKSDYKSLCVKCPDAVKCAYTNQANTHQSALTCLKNNGDVAYLSLEIAQQFIETTPGAGLDFAFVCPNLTLGSNAKECNFAQQPWSSIVALKEVATELGPKLNEWLRPLEPRLSPTDVPEREIGGWQRALIDLLLEDYHHYNSLQQKIDLKTFVGRGRRLKGSEPEICDRKVRWCLEKLEEKPKCSWMSTAAWYAGILPPIDCLVEQSERDCVHKVSENHADVVVANIDLAHYAKSTQKLTAVRFVETPNDHLSSVVAVVKADSAITSFAELKSKKACFPSYEGIGYGAFLREGLNQSLIDEQTCPYHASVAGFFSESCAPGASEHAENEQSLCSLCQKTGGESCAASPTNNYYDDVGAMKCLKNSGDVAFVRLQEILLAFQKNLFDRMHLDEFKVICNNSSQKDTTIPLGPNAIKCALATVPSHAVLSRANDEVTRTRDISIVLSSLDKLFGLDDTPVLPGPVFHIYHPFADNPNLIFPDGASSLMLSNAKDPSVKQYQKLISDVPRPCGHNSAFTTSPGVFVTFFVTFVAFILSR